MKTNLIQSVGQIGISVKNLDHAIEFYKEKLGLSLLFNTDRMAFFDCNGLRILLSLPEKEEFAHSSSVIYFQVENIKEAYANLIEKDVTFIDELHIVAKMGQIETWMAFFKDTEKTQGRFFCFQEAKEPFPCLPYFPNLLRYPHFLHSSSTATLCENPSTSLLARSPSIISEKGVLLIFPRLITPSPSKQQGITVPFAKIPA